MIRLEPGCLATLRDHCAHATGHGAGGLLVGWTASPGRRFALSAHPCPSLDGGAASLDPGDYLRVQAEADEAGLEVVGHYRVGPWTWAPEGIHPGISYVRVRCDGGVLRVDSASLDEQAGPFALSGEPVETEVERR